MIHEKALKGFTSTSAGSYDHGRPDYSTACIERIVSLMNETVQRWDDSRREGVDVFEFGAGTGKFTESFFQTLPNIALKPSLRSYLATDPSEGFLSILQRKQLPNVDCRLGTADATGLPDDSVDFVIAAQSFHWTANDATLREVYRILRPHGLFLMVYNCYDYNEAPWLKQIDEEILSPLYTADVPRQQTGRWRAAFDSDEAQHHQWFSSLQEIYLPYEQRGPRSMVVERILSASVIAEQPADAQDATRHVLDHILDTHASLDNARTTNAYSIPYHTIVAFVRVQKHP